MITADGELRQFSGVVLASHALSGDSGCALCNADDVELDGCVTAVGPREELRLGELYFAVPRAALKRRLRAEEIGALAIKAGAALAKAGVVLELGEGRKREKEHAFSAWLSVIPEGG